MKVSRLSLFQKAFWGPFYCLMLVTLSGSHTEDQNTFSDISDRTSLRFIETTNHYLRIQQILQTDYVYDAIQCALNCLVKTPCISFNFRLKADLKGKHLCELLASDKFKHAIYLQPDAEFHHYSIWIREISKVCDDNIKIDIHKLQRRRSQNPVNPLSPKSDQHQTSPYNINTSSREKSPCEYGVCQHGSTCLPLYETHGFLCHCVPGYTGIYCEHKVPVWLKVNTQEVCFGARDNLYGPFTMKKSGSIVSFKLVHLRGQISCRTVDSRYSYWACDKGDILQTFITNASNAVVLPPLSDIPNYQISGMRSDSSELTFNNLTVPLKVAPGQEFRVWYREDLKDVSESDNGGKTCMDIYSLYV